MNTSFMNTKNQFLINVCAILNSLKQKVGVSYT